MNDYCLGCIPDNDPYHISDDLTDETYPISFSLIPHLQPIRDQGNERLCVGYAVACMREYQKRKGENFSGYLSPHFIYDRRPNKPQPGMKIRDALAVLRTDGIPTEEDYNRGSTSRARQNRIGGYEKIPSRSKLKDSLTKYGPCPISFPVYNYSENLWTPKPLDLKPLGYHSMVVVGWDSEGFILRNSWGAKWGDQGYAKYPFSEFGSHDSLWVSYPRPETLDCVFC